MYRIDHSPASYQRNCRSLQLAALDALLPNREIEAICRDLGHEFRRRELPPGVTVRSMVYRGLHPDHSIPAMLADLAALLGPDQSVPTDSAWCQARCRLPQEVLTTLIHRRAHACRRRYGKLYRWHDRWVFIVDGSTVSMPDEPALVDAFPYADTRYGPSRFPVARITFLELAGLQEIWDFRMGPYRQSEESQFQEMWPGLPRGCICLLDRKFCSFYILAKLRQRGIGVITPLNQRRIPQKLISLGRSLGPNEWRVPLDLCPQLRRRYNDPTLPAKLWVRLIRVDFQHGSRCRTLWLITTLLDPCVYPAAEVAQEYRRRWGIEGRIGSLKTTLEMNVLRGKSPNAILREVASIVLGHNLVWMLMHEAAAQADRPVEVISFAGAVKVVLAYSHALHHAPRSQRPALYQKMLLHIAAQQNHHPFDRVEPRLIKRETSRFAYLREPRWKARLKCLT
jgi:hypothetical protein